MMYAQEMFEEVFEEAMVEFDKAWYELYDSDDFAIVEQRIVERYGAEALESEEYHAWEREMYWDL